MKNFGALSWRRSAVAYGGKGGLVVRAAMNMPDS
jgi:hypothetical protein